MKKTTTTQTHTKTKKCTMCKQVKPATIDYYFVRQYKSGETGVQSYCKVCAKFRDGKDPRIFLNSTLCALRNRAKRQKNSDLHTLVTITTDELLSLYKKQRGRCAMTNVKMTHIRGQGIVRTNISIDRIDASGGYTIDNVQLVCHMVNVMKYSNSTTSLLRWCQRIVNHTKPNRPTQPLRFLDPSGNVVLPKLTQSFSLALSSDKIESAPLHCHSLSKLHTT